MQDDRLKDVKAAQPLAKPGPPFLEIIRFAMPPGQDGQARGYFIGMSFFDATQDQARVVMDALAKTFKPIEVKPAVSAETTK